MELLVTDRSSPSSLSGTSGTEHSLGSPSGSPLKSGAVTTGALSPDMPANSPAIVRDRLREKQDAYLLREIRRCALFTVAIRPMKFLCDMANSYFKEHDLGTVDFLMSEPAENVMYRVMRHLEVKEEESLRAGDGTSAYSEYISSRNHKDYPDTAKTPRNFVEELESVVCSLDGLAGASNPEVLKKVDRALLHLYHSAWQRAFEDVRQVLDKLNWNGQYLRRSPSGSLAEADRKALRDALLASIRWTKRWLGDPVGEHSQDPSAGTGSARSVIDSGAATGSDDCSQPGTLPSGNSKRGKRKRVITEGSSESEASARQTPSQTRCRPKREKRLSWKAKEASQKGKKRAGRLRKLHSDESSGSCGSSSDVSKEEEFDRQSGSSSGDSDDGSSSSSSSASQDSESELVMPVVKGGSRGNKNKLVSAPSAPLQVAPRKQQLKQAVNRPQQPPTPASAAGKGGNAGPSRLPPPKLHSQPPLPPAPVQRPAKASFASSKASSASAKGRSAAPSRLPPPQLQKNAEARAVEEQTLEAVVRGLEEEKNPARSKVVHLVGLKLLCFRLPNNNKRPYQLFALDSDGIVVRLFSFNGMLTGIQKNIVDPAGVMVPCNIDVPRAVITRSSFAAAKDWEINNPGHVTVKQVPEEDWSWLSVSMAALVPEYSIVNCLGVIDHVGQPRDVNYHELGGRTVRLTVASYDTSSDAKIFVDFYGDQAAIAEAAHDSGQLATGSVILLYAACVRAGIGASSSLPRLVVTDQKLKDSPFQYLPTGSFSLPDETEEGQLAFVKHAQSSIVDPSQLKWARPPPQSSKAQSSQASKFQRNSE